MGALGRSHVHLAECGTIWVVLKNIGPLLGPLNENPESAAKHLLLLVEKLRDLRALLLTEAFVPQVAASVGAPRKVLVAL